MDVLKVTHPTLIGIEMIICISLLGLSLVTTSSLWVDARQPSNFGMEVSGSWHLLPLQRTQSKSWTRWAKSGVCTCFRDHHLLNFYSYIIGPDAVHHIYLSERLYSNSHEIANDVMPDEFKKSYPSAKVIGVEPLAAKKEGEFTFDGCKCIANLVGHRRTNRPQCMERTLLRRNMVTKMRCLASESHYILASDDVSCALDRRVLFLWVQEQGRRILPQGLENAGCCRPTFQPASQRAGRYYKV